MLLISFNVKLKEAEVFKLINAKYRLVGSILLLNWFKY